MSKSTEQSIQHKLKDISKTLGIPFNSLLEMLFLEWFLVRIVKSAYADKLVFKGGMCLAQFLDLGRKTKSKINHLFLKKSFAIIFHCISKFCCSNSANALMIKLLLLSLDRKQAKAEHTKGLKLL